MPVGSDLEYAGRSDDDKALATANSKGRRERDELKTHCFQFIVPRLTSALIYCLKSAAQVQGETCEHGFARDAK